MADQLQAKLKKRLEALLKLPENQICCDCGKRGPRWASANLGVFFCIECSGIHRNLGVHICFVRSVNLDTWTIKQVEFMEQWGNARGNAYFESRLPSNYTKPNENSKVRDVERFIREKYEQKKWISDSFPPENGSAAQAQAQAHVAPATSAPKATHAHNTNTHAVPSHGHSNYHKQDTHKAVVAPAPVVHAKEVNLLDFVDDAIHQSPNTAHSFAPHHNNNVNNNSGFGNFSNFSEAPPPAPAHTQTSFATNGFSNFNSAPPVATNDPFFSQAAPTAAPVQNNVQAAPQGASVDPFFGSNFASPAPVQAPVQQKPQASADAIMSLYNKPQAPPQQYGMGGFNNFAPAPANPFGGFPPQQQQFGMQQGFPQQQQQGFAPQQGFGMPQGYPAQQQQFGMPPASGMYPGYGR